MFNTVVDWIIELLDNFRHCMNVSDSYIECNTIQWLKRIRWHNMY